MQEPIDTIPYKGFFINIFPDEDARSPQEWEEENDHFLAYYHRDFYIKSKIATEEKVRAYFEDGEKKLFKDYFVFPVYAYIHSGVSLSLAHNGDKWDTSLMGAYFVAKKEFKTKTKALERAKNAIKTWNDYLVGAVYSYKVEGIEAESCWGFYGEEGYKQAISEAKESIDNHIQSKIKEHNKKLKALIANRVPLFYRPAFSF